MNFYQFFIEKYINLNKQVKCFAFYFGFLTAYYILLWMVPMNYTLFGLFLLLSGWLSWTFFEYILHRFWMHDKDAKDNSPMAQRHHHHHTHPTDIKVTPMQRLLLFGIVSALLVCSIYVSVYLLIIVGFVFGFSGYTMMHWVLHQRWSVKVFPRLHRYHIYHHCKYPNSCYGISVCWWDLLFKTTPPNEPVLVKRIVDFYFSKPNKQ